MNDVKYVFASSAIWRYIHLTLDPAGGPGASLSLPTLFDGWVCNC